MPWWGILLIILAALIVLLVLSIIFYYPFFKRFWDIVCSLLAIIVLSPLLLILTIAGAIVMKGNPFFTQDRPGKNEKIFKLIKFRSMTCEKDKEGNLLPDEDRLTKYGEFIRKYSLDELPELFNILIGDMSVIGPRPLAVNYLPFYNENEKHRHDVRPGLSGLAQINGRNSLSWEDKFKFDLEYIKSVSLFNDIRIIIVTIIIVFKHKDIGERGVNKLIDFDVYRKNQGV